MLKFKEEKRPGLLGLTTIFTEIGESGQPYDVETPFKLHADSGGIRITGNSPRLASMDDLQIFAKVLDSAWRAHRILIPKIYNAAGH